MGRAENPFHTCPRGPFSNVRHKLVQIDPQRLWALVIGIDRYINQDIPDLRGAVNDARSMSMMLQHKFSLPSQQIAYLENQAATRSNIIESFGLLEELPMGTPIFIYLACRGTKVLYGDEEVEAIIPFDCDSCSRTGSIYPIPCKLITCLIESLFQKIDAKITLIFDCCFIRGDRPCSDYDKIRQWSCPKGYIYSSSLDPEIIVPNHLDQATASPSSYVLLTACREDEEARESQVNGIYHGDFTRALLDALRSVDISLLTPVEIMDQLKLVRQNPQCYGKHIKRPLLHEAVAAPCLRCMRERSKWRVM